MKVAAIQGDERVLPSAQTAARGAIGGDFADALARTMDAADNREATHTVQRGETLSHIVRDHLRASDQEFRTPDIYAGVRQVARDNGLNNPDRIYPGQEIDLSALGPTETVARTEQSAPRPEPTEKPAEAVASEKRAETPGAVHENEPFFTDLGEIRAKSEDKPAEPKLSEPRPPETQAVLNPVNEDRIRAFIDDMRTTFGVERPETGDKSSLWRAILEDPGRITSEFGMRKSPITGRWQYHRGVDIAAPQGSPIYPLKPGEVEYSGWKSGYGNVVIVRHDDGAKTVYGHNARNLVGAGDAVSQDTALATVGATGHATGPHVHFEVRKNGRSVDPVPVLKAHAAENELRAQR